MKFTQGLFISAISLLLASCGGGGGNTGPTPESQTLINSAGVWSGQTSTTPPDFPLMVVRPNGETWLFNTDAFSIQGFGLFTLTESGNNVTSSSGKYFSETDGVLTTSIDGSALKGATFGGSFRFPSLNASTTFSTKFRQTAELDLSQLTRKWQAGDGFDLTIQANGAFAAVNSAGCQISGTITPTGEGYSIGSVNATTGQTCRIPSTSMTGLLYSTGASFWMALLTPAKDNRYLFYSRRCSDGRTYSGVDFTWSCM